MYAATQNIARILVGSNEVWAQRLADTRIDLGGFGTGLISVRTDLAEVLLVQVSLWQS